jgi:hypothetical protein
MEDLLEEIGKELLPSQAQETYQTLAKIFGNILDNPTEAKFKSLKKDNKVIAGKILRSNHAASLLLTIGFDDDGTTYTLPQEADLELLRTAHDLLQCIVLSAEDATPAPQASAPPVAAAAVTAAAVGGAAVAASAAKPAVPADPRGFGRRDDAEAKRQAQADQLQAARAARGAQFQENPQGPPPPAVPAKQAAGYPADAQHEDHAKKNKPTAFDFKDRGKAEQEKNRAASSLEEMRKAQKDKFKEFQSDPNAKNQQAYKAPPSTVGGKADDGWGGWFGGMFGGGSSSNGSSGPSSKPQDRRDRPGPRIKGVADLPKPPPRAGG